MKTIKKLTALILCLILTFSFAFSAFASQTTTEALPFEDSRYFETGDYTIHYRVWNAQNEKGQIFMIHGFALSSYCWCELAKILTENGYTCVLADLPDFGYSSRETAETQKLPREDIMHSLMTYLSDKPWYVAGHSMGGYIAIKLAEKYPQSVKNLLLYGTSGNSENSAVLNNIMSNEAFINIMGPLMQLMARMTFLVRLLAIAGLHDISYGLKYDISEIQKPLSIDGTGKGAIYSFSMLPQTNFDAVKAFAPVLYVNGSKDSVISESARQKLRGYLPEGSTDKTVEGGGHMFIENKAVETAKITLDFLSEHM